MSYIIDDDGRRTGPCAVYGDAIFIARCPSCGRFIQPPDQALVPRARIVQHVRRCDGAHSQRSGAFARPRPNSTPSQPPIAPTTTATSWIVSIVTAGRSTLVPVDAIIAMIVVISRVALSATCGLAARSIVLAPNTVSDRKGDFI